MFGPTINTPMMRLQIRDSTRAWIDFHFTTHCNVDQEPEMLQTDALCEHPMQRSKNATATGLYPGPRCGAYSASPDS